MPFGICGLLNTKLASGMDYWRVMIPLLHMKSLGYPVQLTRLGNDLPSWDGEPPKVIVLCEPYAGTFGEDRRTLKLCRKLGALLVVDIADDPTPRETGPLVRTPYMRMAKLECVREADLVTVQSQAMAEIVKQYNPHVEVLPDLAEAAHWTAERPTNRPQNLTIGVRGGNSHKDDWAMLEEPWLKIAEEYPDVHFVSAGLEVDWMAKIPHGRYWHWGWSMFTEYQEHLKWIDIGCLPLTSDPFNASKSPIGFYDFSLAGAVSLGSADTIYDPPIRDSATGFLCDDNSWYDFLKIIINLSGEDRTALAMQAKQWVIEHRCMNQWWALQRYNAYRSHWGRIYEGTTGDPIPAAEENEDVRDAISLFNAVGAIPPR